MVVIISLPAPEKDVVWYLAYGSNLSSSKFVRDRGIVPLDSAVVSIPGFTLAMDSAGVPYREPSFASIRPINLNAYPKERPALGTAYLVTSESYSKIIASEGGGIAYREIAVEVQTLEDATGPALSMTARTLVTVMERLPEPRPSKRYMTLITSGAAEARFPGWYQEYLQKLPCYEPPTSGLRRVGAVLFLAIWLPVMALMEKITKATVNRGTGGNAPEFVVWLVRMGVFAMWWYHDHVSAPLWGRGDGRDDLTVTARQVTASFRSIGHDSL